MRRWSVIGLFLIITLAPNNDIQGQQPSKDWEMVLNDYFASYGQECDILVFKDHTVVRDVFLFTPSIYCTLKDIEIPGNKLILNIRIEKKEDNFLIGDIQIRIFNELHVINDNELDSCILKGLKSLKVEALKNTTIQDNYNFGIVFRSPLR